MSKLKREDVVEAGWNESQFADVTDWQTNGGFLDKLIDRAGRETSYRIGATAYAAAAADTVEADRIIEAELAFVESRLWRKRAAHWDAGSATSLDDSAYLNQREYLKQAREAWTRFLEAIGLLKDGAETLGSGVSIGVVETGPYPLAEAS